MLLCWEATSRFALKRQALQVTPYTWLSFVLRVFTVILDYQRFPSPSGLNLQNLFQSLRSFVWLSAAKQ